MQAGTTIVRHDDADPNAAAAAASVFSKAAFVADDNAVELDDPEFWSKMLPDATASASGGAGPTALGKRKKMQAQRFGMVGEVVADADAIHSDHDDREYHEPAGAPHKRAKLGGKDAVTREVGV